MILMLAFMRLNTCRRSLGYIRGADAIMGVAEEIAATATVPIGTWSIPKKELLSAQPVLDPWIVNAAVVVPQSHSSLGLSI